jgi:recombinational DNA repair ATPase RecF
MRLNEVWIEEFKNLRNLTVNFDAESPYTVLVGENGAGKSNLLEALTIIFRNLDLNRKADFSYRITYQCRENRLRVIAHADQYPTFAIQAAHQTDYKKNLA